MTKPNYTAPALEKGLLILKLLAHREGAMSALEIAAELGRSKAEIYRMLLTLEHLDFIRRDETGNGYLSTSRLFELGMRHPTRQTLIQAALPQMQILARDTGQSCHLMVVSHDAVVVLLRAESETNISLSVKVGFRVSAVDGTSGRIFYAFQSRPQRAAWLGWLRTRVERSALRAFLQDAKDARRQGYFSRDSFYTEGVTDIVVPILKDGHAVAALVVPFIHHINNTVSQSTLLEKLISAGNIISARL